jgi:hypothetical protein
MRGLLAIVSLVMGFVTVASAQPVPRFEVGPVARYDRVFIEGDASGGAIVGGVATRLSLSKRYGVDAELTWTTNEIERSYEGWFVSYATGPNLPREEIERLAPVARRTLGYAPGVGGAAAFVVRGEVRPHVSLAARVGVSARRYLETSTYHILTIPEGVDPVRVARDFEDSQRRRTRGGLLLGCAASIAVTDRLRLEPELRVVYGGPAQVGNKYRELGLGARGVWRF